MGWGWAGVKGMGREVPVGSQRQAKATNHSNNSGVPLIWCICDIN